MQRRPLADDLRPDPRVVDLIGGRAGVLIGGDIADAVAAGLDGVHLHRGQISENGRDVGQRRPVVLQVLPGGEMGVALVVTAGDVGELTHLP